MKATETKTIQKLKKELKAANEIIAKQNVAIRMTERIIDNLKREEAFYKERYERECKNSTRYFDAYCRAMGEPAKPLPPSHLKVVKTLN